MRDHFHHYSDRLHARSPADGGGGGSGASSSRSPSEMRSMPDALRGPAFDRMHDAWAEARRRHEPELPAFVDSLKALARDAREKHLDVAELLKALDSVTRPENGGEPGLDWDHVREIAGRVVIRAYYRDD
jgi:hypothetical protein